MSGPLTRIQRGEAGQAVILLVGAITAALLVVPVFAAVGRAVVFRDHNQHLADRAALAAANRMRSDYWRLSVPPTLTGGASNPAHLNLREYIDRARAAARKRAARDGFESGRLTVQLTGGSAPDTVEVTLRRRERPDRRRLGRARVSARAVAQLIPEPDAFAAPPQVASGGGYSGLLAYRQGKPVRPDVARAFDQMARAGAAVGVHLIVSSALRTDAEQARLFAQHPDPQWVARPGTSLHRYGTELDLGPPSAYGWLARNARGFGFIKRYAWEPWHFGYARGHSTGRKEWVGPAKSRWRVQGVNPRDVPADYDVGSREPVHGSVRPHLVPSFVPPRYVAAIARAAQRWDVSAQLLSAQIYAESGFNPNATSTVGARGIAQFMPATARAYGLKDPSNANAAIDAQAHLMHDLLKRFDGNVALALAGYNAGPARVAGCGCVPAFSETRAYVNRIVAMLNGAGDIVMAGVDMEAVFVPKLID